MSIKLTDTQLIVLSAAAQREDRCLVASNALRGGAAQKFAAKLLAAGLAKEIKATPNMPVWRRDGETGSLALKITAAGLKAITVDDREADEEAAHQPLPAYDEAVSPSTISAIASTASPMDAVPSASSPREGSKLAKVIGLLSRDNGATLAELVAATGWLAHTTRAALTGLRKRGFAVELDRSNKELGSTYRIVGDQGALKETKHLEEESPRTNGALAKEAPVAAPPLKPMVASTQREQAPRSPKRKAA
jgi:Protein of unknown function (DUF3489)